MLWSPDNPVLYDIDITLSDGNMEVDNVKSYTGFRVIRLGDTGDGFTRILFNNEFLYQNGPLDQGFWPDGIYTAPSDEALRFDIEFAKSSFPKGRTLDGMKIVID